MIKERRKAGILKYKNILKFPFVKPCEIPPSIISGRYPKLWRLCRKLGSKKTKRGLKNFLTKGVTGSFNCFGDYSITGR
jgi:hypothetical protein